MDTMQVQKISDGCLLHDIAEFFFPCSAVSLQTVNLIALNPPKGKFLLLGVGMSTQSAVDSLLNDRLQLIPEEIAKMVREDLNRAWNLETLTSEEIALQACPFELESLAELASSQYRVRGQYVLAGTPK